jgi:hypothetical protein
MDTNGQLQIPVAFTSEARISITHCARGRVFLLSDLDVLQKRKSAVSTGISTTNPLSVSP